MRRWLQRFHRNTYEVSTWLHEKLNVATDMCYTDPTNLQSKIQKHAAFEAELTANSGRIEAVAQEGSELVAKGHYAQAEIQVSNSFQKVYVDIIPRSYNLLPL